MNGALRNNDLKLLRILLRIFLFAPLPPVSLCSYFILALMFVYLFVTDDCFFRFMLYGFCFLYFLFHNVCFVFVHLCSLLKCSFFVFLLYVLFVLFVLFYSFSKHVPIFILVPTIVVLRFLCLFFIAYFLFYVKIKKPQKEKCFLVKYFQPLKFVILLMLNRIYFPY